jgi:hypothetical protein
MDPTAHETTVIECDGVTVTVVESTWRAVVVEIREGDDVRWATVPRRDVDRFLAAAAAGLLAIPLRDILGSVGSHRAIDVETGFGVFDTRPDGRVLLAPERAPSGKDGRDHEHPRRRLHRPRHLVAIGAGIAALTAGGVAVATIGGGGGAPAAATTPATAMPETTTEPAGTVDAATTAPATDSLVPTLPLDPTIVEFPAVAASLVQFSDFTGTFEGAGDQAVARLRVECAEPNDCVLHVDESQSSTTFAVVDDEAHGESTGVNVLGAGCPPEWAVTVRVDLVFGFDEGAATPGSVSGSIVADQPLLQAGNTVCFGRHVEWKIDVTHA